MQHAANVLLSSVTGKISNSEVLDSFDKSPSVPYASEHTQMLLDGQNILEHINPENALLTTDDDDVMTQSINVVTTGAHDVDSSSTATSDKATQESTDGVDENSESELAMTTHETSVAATTAAASTQAPARSDNMPPAEVQSRNRALAVFSLDTTAGGATDATNDDEVEMTSQIEQTTVSDNGRYFNDMISNSASFQRSIPPNYVYPSAFDPGYHFINVTGRKMYFTYTSVL